MSQASQDQNQYLKEKKEISNQVESELSKSSDLIYGVSVSPEMPETLETSAFQDSLTILHTPEMLEMPEYITGS